MEERIAWNGSEFGNVAAKAARRKPADRRGHAGHRRLLVRFLHLLARLPRGQCRHGCNSGSDRRPRAFGYLEKICELGPRIAGSEANTRQRKMVAAHFKATGGTVREQPFTAEHPITGERVNMVNLIGSWHPERNKRVVIGAHYDTRPHPDEERDPARQQLPFLGANDGASGVALLMEMANHLKTLNSPWGIDLVIFDGEELVFGRHPETQGEYFLGSKAFARAYVEDVEAGEIPAGTSPGWCWTWWAAASSRSTRSPTA